MNEHELREAVQELHDYLADRLAPLMVADSMGLLLQQPPAFVAREIAAWVDQQQVSAAVSDLLFHAVRKVWLLGEFELAPREELASFVRELSEGVLECCPDGERDVLRQNLERLGYGSVVRAPAQLEVIHRPAAPAAKPAAAPASPEQGLLSRAMSAGLKRLGLYLERLQPQSPTAAATPEQRSQVTSQVVSTAARESKDSTDLERNLASLRAAGVPVEPERVFRALADTLAGWGALPSVAGGAPGTSAPARAASELEAMRRMVALVGDPAEAGRRFRELVHAAIDQFNQGNLGRAAAMFDVAEQLVAEQRVNPLYVEPLRNAHEYLDAERLRKHAERTDSRATLLRVISFFTALRPEGLLAALDGEPSRDRRRQLLALLEAHGAPARAAAREKLRAHVEDSAPMDAFLPMNLVYLLRAIPRPDDVALDEEVQLVMRTPGRASPPPLVKQVLSYLAFTRHDRAERALVTFLRVFETMLLQPDSASYPPAEVDVLLDRTCVALARFGTPRAWRALVDHGLNAEARLGATLKRLAEAGRSQNLAASPEIVGRLLAALQAELPRGMFKRRNDERVAFLIQALSGTPTAPVIAALQDIAERFAGQKIGTDAARALTTLKAAAKPEQPAGLSGDLELFGLPDLLQTLSNTRVTGVLTLMGAQGLTEATVLFEEGLFRGARHRSLQGTDAVYQLFERPFPGTFAFVARKDHLSTDNVEPPRPMIDLIFEGVRRHDELKQAATLVPDNARLARTGQPWTPMEDENRAFAEQVWQAIQGASAVEGCEARLAADSFRVRRLLAHWVEEGALALQPAS